MPRFILFVQATPSTNAAGNTPSPDELEQMTIFNESLHLAGVLLSADGLRPTDVDTYRISYSPESFGGRGEPRVSKGPFDISAAEGAGGEEEEEMGGDGGLLVGHVSGWWILRCQDAEEALGWAKKVPFRGGSTVLRRIAEVEDFENMDEDMKIREEQLRESLEGRDAGDMV